MLDLIFEFLGEILDSAGDVIESVGEAAVDVASSVDIGDMLLIAGTIYVANLTASSIRDELRGRQEIKDKGGVKAIIDSMKKEQGATVVQMHIINKDGKRVGQLSMQGQTSKLYVGQSIDLR